MTATTYNKNDLRTRVLRDAGVLDHAESAGATEAANVDPVIQASIEEIEAEGLVIFNPLAAETVDNIPARIFLPLAAFVLAQGMGSYGIPRDEDARHGALRRLRRQVKLGSDDTPVRACYF